jgi:accessory gene regulator protein AgrB
MDSFTLPISTRSRTLDLGIIGMYVYFTLAFHLIRFLSYMAGAHSQHSLQKVHLPFLLSILLSVLTVYLQPQDSPLHSPV